MRTSFSITTNTNPFGIESENRLVFVIIEKLVRITIFLGYLALISRMPDLQRVFEYHGAEHKTISCYEADEELTPENAQRYSRFHPRCGTSFLLPVGLTSLVKDELPNSIVFVLVEKAIRITIFLGYLVLISRLPDLRRVFEYHGAEHKTIACFEGGEPLTPENAQRYSRLHPRCGTSFLLIVMIVAIFVFAPLGTPAWYILFPSRVVGIPLVAGIAFEAIKWFGRNRNKRWARVLMWPGLQLQRLTTREPDLSQLAVAIAAMEAVLAVEDPLAASEADRAGMEVAA